MAFRGAVVIIGSLYWENTENREKWRSANLDFERSKDCRLPIRYGRSARSRDGVYTMTFSAELKVSEWGTCKIIPMAQAISSRELFKHANKELAAAEGIIKPGEQARQTIVTGWATNCISINPNIGNDAIGQISAWWTEFFLEQKEIHNRLNTSSRFSIRGYGLSQETRCIDESGFLQIPFPHEGLEDIDFLIATATKIKHRISKELVYPTPLEIGTAMVHAKCFNYFFNNIEHGISTFQDDKVKKVLRKRFRLNLNKALGKANSV